MRGKNLLFNASDNGVSVAAYDRDAERVGTVRKLVGSRRIARTESPMEFISDLRRGTEPFKPTLKSSDSEASYGVSECFTGRGPEERQVGDSRSCHDVGAILLRRLPQYSAVAKLDSSAAGLSRQVVTETNGEESAIVPHLLEPA